MADSFQPSTMDNHRNPDNLGCNHNRGTLSKYTKHGNYILVSEDKQVAVPKDAMEKCSGYFRSMVSFQQHADGSSGTGTCEHGQPTAGSDAEHRAMSDVVVEKHKQTPDDVDVENELISDVGGKHDAMSDVLDIKHGQITDHSNAKHGQISDGLNGKHELISDVMDQIITLNNLHGYTLRYVAEFACSGKVDFAGVYVDCVMTLLVTADFLDIPLLVDACVRRVISVLTIDNCVDVINVVEVVAGYNNDKLLKGCQDFIVRNFNELPKEQYMEFSSNTLLRFLGDEKLHILSELSLVNVVKDWMSHKKGVYWEMLPDDIDIKDNTWVIFTDLMSEIHWPLIRPDKYETIDAGVKIMMKRIHGCQQLIKEAKDYQSDVRKQPMKQSKRTQVRSDGPSLCCMDYHNSNVNNQFFRVFHYETWSEQKIRYQDSKEHFYKMVILDNYLYIMFLTSAYAGKSKVLRYDPRFNEWLTISSHNMWLDVVLACRAMIYVIGWDTEQCLCYDIKKNRWRRMAPLHMGITHGKRGCVVRDTLYISGGIHKVSMSLTPNSDTLNIMYKYDVTIGKWQQCGSMIHPRYYHIMESVNDDVIYVIGGERADTIERYSIETNMWTQCTQTLAVMYAASYVDKGRIYIVGGHYYDQDRDLQSGTSVRVFTEDCEAIEKVVELSENNCYVDSLCGRMKFPYTFWSDEQSDDISAAEGPPKRSCVIL